MSSSGYLGKLNKPKLSEFARYLNISDKAKKAELAFEIESILLEHRKQYQNDPMFEEYYETLPNESAPVIVPTPKTVARRRSRYSKPPGDEEIEEPIEPFTDIITPIKKSTTVVKSALRSSRRSSRNAASTLIEAIPDVPLSPGDLANSVSVDRMSLSNIGNAVSTWFESSAKYTGFWEQVDYARETLSDSRTIHAIIASYEFAWLCNDLLPVEHYRLTLPIDSPTFMSSADIKIPQLFILLSWTAFWRPIAYWFILGVSMPLFASYFVNISNKTKYDPLTFSVTKALIAYLVYTKQLVRPEIPGLFTPDTAVLVSSIIGDETPLIGAAIGGLLTFWEAIVKKR